MAAAIRFPLCSPPGSMCSCATARMGRRRWRALISREQEVMGDSWPTGISGDGRYALFEGSASDLVPGDTNNVNDVFVRDLANGTTFLVSTNINGGCVNGVSRG